MNGVFFQLKSRRGNHYPNIEYTTESKRTASPFRNNMRGYVQVLIKSHKDTGVVSGVIREIGKINAVEMSRDSSTARNIHDFLVDMAQRVSVPSSPLWKKLLYIRVGRFGSETKKESSTTFEILDKIRCDWLRIHCIFTLILPCLGGDDSHRFQKTFYRLSAS